MNTEFKTTFVVFPKDCNKYQYMVFGGKMLAEMDICAALTVGRFLYDSPNGCDAELTVGVDKVSLLDGPVVGDLIEFRGKIVHTGIKSIRVWVEGWRLTKASEEKVSVGQFAFVSAKMVDGKPVITPHGMKI